MLLVLAMSGACAGADASGARHRLLWHDEFNGRAGSPPNPKKWGWMTGGNGWGNQELECYTDAAGNASMDGRGHLVITAIRQPGHVCSDGKVNDYTSARITTQHHATFRYGTIEVRAKLPSAAGTWPAFWALGRDHDVVGWPASGEIDVMEEIGSEPHQVLGTIHGPRSDGSHWMLPHRSHVAASLASGFHTFAVRWTRSGVSWYVDGKRYARTSRAQVARQGRWVFDKRFYLLLNLAVGGTLGGAPDQTAGPQRYVVDWVRVYS